MSQKWIFSIMVAGWMLSISVSSAAITVPDWVSGDDTVSVLYRFETGETNPPPSEASNLSAAAAIEIHNVTAAGGWADPSVSVNSFITRENGGTWQIIENEYVNLFLPLVAEPSENFYVEFFIDVIVGQMPGMVDLPGIDVMSSDTLDIETAVLFDDPFLGWVQMGCTGLVSLASATNLFVSVSCYDNGLTSNTSSVIDQIAVYARVIPEPAVMGLLAFAGGMLLFMRRIFSW